MLSHHSVVVIFRQMSEIRLWREWSEFCKSYCCGILDSGFRGFHQSISWHHSTVPCIEGRVPSSKHHLFPHKLFALTTMGYCVAWLVKCTSFWVLIQHWNDCNLSYLSLAISEHTPLLLLGFFFGIHLSLPPLVCFSLWRKLGGHCSGFLHGILIAMLWLAEVHRWLAAGNLQLLCFCLWRKLGGHCSVFFLHRILIVILWMAKMYRWLSSVVTL